MHDVLGRVFQAGLSVLLLTLASGVWMPAHVARQVVQYCASFWKPLARTIMAVLGLVMLAIFMHICFVRCKWISRTVAASEPTAGSAALAELRR